MRSKKGLTLGEVRYTLYDESLRQSEKRRKGAEER